MSAPIVKDWTTEAGLRAVIVMTEMGHHCGYVGVPPGHPLHGVGYSQPCDALSPMPDSEPLGKRGVLAVFCAAGDPERARSPEMVFDVHGSITYSGGSPDYPAQSDNLWWFGYDCAHAGDSPSPEAQAKKREMHPDHRFLWERTGEFRDIDYCVTECESLARQIAQATGVHS